MTEQLVLDVEEVPQWRKDLDAYKSRENCFIKQEKNGMTTPAQATTRNNQAAFDVLKSFGINLDQDIDVNTGSEVPDFDRNGYLTFSALAKAIGRKHATSHNLFRDRLVSEIETQLKAKGYVTRSVHSAHKKYSTLHPYFAAALLSMFGGDPLKGRAKSLFEKCEAKAQKIKHKEDVDDPNIPTHMSIQTFGEQNGLGSSNLRMWLAKNGYIDMIENPMNAGNRIAKATKFSIDSGWMTNDKHPTLPYDRVLITPKGQKYFNLALQYDTEGMTGTN
jgi:hypothetical protein